MVTFGDLAPAGVVLVEACVLGDTPQRVREAAAGGGPEVVPEEARHEVRHPDFVEHEAEDNAARSAKAHTHTHREREKEREREREREEVTKVALSIDICTHTAQTARDANKRTFCFVLIVILVCYYTIV